MSKAIPLQLYIGEDNQIWAASDQIAFRIAPATGQSQFFPEPPDATSGGGGGSGGGSTNDPTKVLKTGDTMTGTLLFSGDKFDASIGGNSAAIALQSSQNGPSGFQLDTFGDLALTGSRKHLIIRQGGIDLITADNSRLTIATDYGAFSVQWVSSGGPGVTLGLDSASGDITVQGNTAGFGMRFVNGADGSTTRLHLGPGGSGDIIATAVAGPNAGKSVNLTTGKWA